MNTFEQLWEEEGAGRVGGRGVTMYLSHVGPLPWTD